MLLCYWRRCCCAVENYGCAVAVRCMATFGGPYSFGQLHYPSVFNAVVRNLWSFPQLPWGARATVRQKNKVAVLAAQLFGIHCGLVQLRPEQPWCKVRTILFIQVLDQGLLAERQGVMRLPAAPWHHVNERFPPPAGFVVRHQQLPPPARPAAEGDSSDTSEEA